MTDGGLTWRTALSSCLRSLCSASGRMPWYWLTGSVALESGLSTFLSLPFLKKKMGLIGPLLALLLSEGLFLLEPHYDLMFDTVFKS